MAMFGTIAPTDFSWYEFLSQQPNLDEVNFWRPSAARSFRADYLSPFFFKLKAPHNAICGFGFFAAYSAIPYWLAWEAFGVGNGCTSRKAMIDRITLIRERMGFRGNAPVDHIGCILIVNPTFFAEADWIPQPNNWPPRNLTPMRFDLETGEGARVWGACLARANYRRRSTEPAAEVELNESRFGAARYFVPRLGQGTFRIAITDAYNRACVVSGEHSLPVLEAAHIRPYSEDGPHAISNGLLLRADFHRLFDQGYISVTPDLRLVVSQRLKEEYENGHSYYPFHGHQIASPKRNEDLPSKDFLQWHNENCFRG